MVVDLDNERGTVRAGHMQVNEDRHEYATHPPMVALVVAARL